jgi:hypothetical protein
MDPTALELSNRLRIGLYVTPETSETDLLRYSEIDQLMSFRRRPFADGETGATNAHCISSRGRHPAPLVGFLKF